jgi:voltage-gated potassium channel
MMIGGIGLIGFVTGSLASWIVERISTEDRQRGEAGDSAALLGEIRALRAEMAELRAEAGVPPRGATPPNLRHLHDDGARVPSCRPSQVCHGPA